MTGNSKVSQPVVPQGGAGAISYKEAAIPPPTRIFPMTTFTQSQSDIYYDFYGGPGNAYGTPVPPADHQVTQERTIYEHLDTGSGRFLLATIVRTPGDAPSGQPAVTHSDVADWTHLEGLAWTWTYDSGFGSTHYSYRMDLWTNTLTVPLPEELTISPQDFPPPVMSIAPPGYSQDSNGDNAIMFLCTQSQSPVGGPTGILRHGSGLSGFSSDDWWSARENDMIVFTAFGHSSGPGGAAFFPSFTWFDNNGDLLPGDVSNAYIFYAPGNPNYGSGYAWEKANRDIGQAVNFLHRTDPPPFPLSPTNTYNLPWMATEMTPFPG